MVRRGVVVWLAVSAACGVHEPGSRAATAGAALSVGAELAPVDPTACPSLGFRSGLAMAAFGTHGLVAWHDQRFGNVQSSLGAIYGFATELNENFGGGVMLAPFSQTAPALATDGQRFVGLWTSHQGADVTLDLTPITVPGDGGLTLGTASHVSLGTSTPCGLSLAYGAGRYLAAWSIGGGLLVQHYDATTLAPLEPQPLMLSNFSSCEVGLDGHETGAGFNGTDFVVAGIDTNGLSLFRVPVGADGGFSGPISVEQHSTPDEVRHVVVASPPLDAGAGFGERDVLIAWDSVDAGLKDGGFATAVLARRMRPDGTLFPFTGATVLSGRGNTRRPAAAASSPVGDFRVVWEDDGRAPYVSLGSAELNLPNTIINPISPLLWQGAQLSSCLTGPPANVIAVCDHDALRPVLAPGQRVTLAFLSDQPWPRSLFSQLDRLDAIDYQRNVVWQELLSRINTDSNDRANIPSQSPAVASSGTDYLLVWQQAYTTHNGFRNLFGRRIDTQGATIGPQFPIVEGAADDAWPSVAFNGNRWLVASTSLRPWEVSHVSGLATLFVLGRLQLTVLDRSGQVLDGGLYLEPSVPSLAGVNRPRVAAVGDRFAITWTDFRSVFLPDGGLTFPNAGNDVRLALVDGSGKSVLDAGSLPLHVATGDQFDPSLATVGGAALVAWVDQPSAVGALTAARVGYDGRVLDAPFRVAQYPSLQREPNVASDGVQWLVSWVDRRDGGGDFFAARVTADAGLLDPGGFAIVTRRPELRAPRATWDGRRWFASWLEVNDAGVSLARGGWWTADAGLEPPSGIVLSEGPYDTFSSALTSNGAGQVLSAVSRMHSGPNGESEQVFTRLLVHDGNGDACATDSDCFSAHCVLGICCNAACTGACATCSTGTCTPLASTVVCRPDAGVCDLTERCDGVSLQCPADARADGGVCRVSAGECDVAESCNGGVDCPGDLLEPSTKVCRDVAVPVCDLAERCDGQSPMCPAVDVKAADQTECATAKECRQGQCVDTIGSVDAGQPRSYYNAFAPCGCSTGALGPGALALALLLSRRRPARGRSRRASVLLVLLLAVPAAAAEKMKLAFLGVAPGVGATAEEARVVSDTLQTELAGTGAFEVVSSADLATLLGIERQKQLMGCSEGSSCLTEIAGALNADRVVTGSLARTGSTLRIDLSFIDARKAVAVGRAGRQYEGGTLEQVVAEATPMLRDLLEGDPALAGRSLTFTRRFGGVVLGLRAEGDLIGRGFAPAVTVELSGRWIGGALTVLWGAFKPGIRLEGRFYPVVLANRLRPYVGIGATVFPPAISLRAALGLAVMVGPLMVFADGAYERFLNAEPAYVKDAVLVAGGAGWHF